MARGLRGQRFPSSGKKACLRCGQPALAAAFAHGLLDALARVEFVGDGFFR
jgi:hypothetical protein